MSYRKEQNCIMPHFIFLHFVWNFQNIQKSLESILKQKSQASLKKAKNTYADFTE